MKYLKQKGKSYVPPSPVYVLFYDVYKVVACSTEDVLSERFEGFIALF